ncbi:MAG: (2Fe-2S)-binding protein [Spirosomataceae bacterium]
MQLKVNGQVKTVEVDPETPLLWVLRDDLDLKATKFGCGMAMCGACTVLVDGQAIRSCSYPVSFVENQNVTTLEGLSPSKDTLHPVQEAWIEEEVPQCGYCQPGFMMAAVDFLARNPNPSEQEIKEGITNICRCGTHPRIIKAIARAAKKMSS